MTLRRLPLYALVVALGTSGPATAATYATANFQVTAPSDTLARQFGDMAEQYRREKALQWLGQEMPNWNRRCPLEVKITAGGAGGATTFTFGGDSSRGVVTSQHMEIHGPARQLLDSVLPHEITHTVLAHHFGRPVPRWADEGGSVLSENDEERYNHDVRCRELLNAGRGIRLSVLFRMAEYPRDMIVLYAQGYSVSAYLVERGGNGVAGRQRLLQFLAVGMQGGNAQNHGTVESWNNAARQVYGVNGVDALEEQWLDALKNPPSRVAARGDRAPGTPTARQPEAVAVRNSAPPVVPRAAPPPTASRRLPPAPTRRGRCPCSCRPSSRGPDRCPPACGGAILAPCPSAPPGSPSPFCGRLPSSTTSTDSSSRR